MLSIVLVLGIFLCVLAPTALMSLFGFNNPPSWITNPFEYRVTSALALSASVIMLAVIAMTWLLGVVGAVAGANVLGGGARSLTRRLSIAGKRVAVVTVMAVCLRVSLLIVLAIAAVFAYGIAVAPQIQSGLPYTFREVIGRNRVTLILLAITTVFWLIAPILRTRYSTALGALAATFTQGRTERVSFALGARFGMELLGTLSGLWGTSTLLLIVLSIVDPSSYRASQPLPVGPLEIQGIPIAVLLVTAFAVLYGIGQVVLAQVYRQWAASRMKNKQKTASTAASSSLNSNAASA